MVVLLFWQVAGGQNLMRIDAHNQVDDFLGGDFAEPRRSKNHFREAATIN